MLNCRNFISNLSMKVNVPSRFQVMVRVRPILYLDEEDGEMNNCVSISKVKIEDIFVGIEQNSAQQEGRTEDISIRSCF